MTDAKRGDLVKIHRIILEPDQRPDTLPDSTRAVPYEAWIKGFLLDEEAEIGEEVRIETLIGREMSGTLCEVNPIDDHSFGVAPRELLPIGKEARGQLTGREGKGEWTSATPE
ncbi:MAG: 2-amino-4-ketopentanoate thiolase [Deltaproteobacteria bacterium]|nr:2-amino-4-ketopentanoate thiolase [Deltaproteobacteria bacterium]